MHRDVLKIVCVIGLILLVAGQGGCSSSPLTIPEALEPQVDPDVSFSKVFYNPETYVGKVVLLGGEVLSAKRLEDGTRLEILQLPLDDARAPISTLGESKGRFFAIEKDFLDPAMFPKDTRVTLVGEVTGSASGKLDEMDYQYPTVEIKHLHVWNEDLPAQARNPGPWYSIFGGGGTGGRVGGGLGIGIGF